MTSTSDGKARPIRSWTIVILVAASVMFILKTTMAYRTFGTNDVLTWQQDLTKIQTRGAIALYEEDVQAFSPNGKPYKKQKFIHPPFMIHVLQFWGLLTALTHLPLGFWMRFSCALADIGSLLVVWRIVDRLPALNIHPVAVLLLAMSPISLFISGFHGNTDPIMIFFALLSVYFAEVRKSSSLAGICMGVAISIKIVPAILIPAMFFYIPKLKHRIQFVVIAISVFFALGLPALVIKPALILYKLVTYSGKADAWGLPLLAFLSGRHATVPRAMLIALICLVSVAMNWPRRRLSLFFQCGLILCLLLFFAPGFGIQYLSWLLPWIICVGLWPVIAYNVAGGFFLFAVYTYWCGGLPWYFANALEIRGITGLGVCLDIGCWAITGFILVRFIKLWLWAARESHLELNPRTLALQTFAPAQPHPLENREPVCRRLSSHVHPEQSSLQVRRSPSGL